MKIRNGFVSNSSSTSFVVPAGHEHEAELMGMTLYRVSDMLSTLKVMKDVIDKFSAGKEVPYFFSYEFYMTIPYYDELVVLEERMPGCYITDEFDRDRAYTEGITDMYETFQSDL